LTRQWWSKSLNRKVSRAPSDLTLTRCYYSASRMALIENYSKFSSNSKKLKIRSPCSQDYFVSVRTSSKPFWSTTSATVRSEPCWNFVNEETLTMSLLIYSTHLTTTKFNLSNHLKLPSKGVVLHSKVASLLVKSNLSQGQKVLRRFSIWFTSQNSLVNLRGK